MPNPKPLIMSLGRDVEIGHQFDAGRSGKENEDNYGLFAIRHSSPDRNVGNVDIQIAVVADGIGGSVGGAEASYLAVHTIQQALSDSESNTDIQKRLVEAVREANRTIYREAQEKPVLAGMGSTIVLAALALDYLYVLHEGDSRAYLVRDGRLHLLTQDHSWVQEAIDARRLTPTEAANHPSRSMIRRYLGVDSDVEVDTQIIDISSDRSGNRRPVTRERLLLQPGDIILLCSDGLPDVVKDSDIERVLSSTDPQSAADRLVRMANANGGPDNITAVVVRWKAGVAPVVPVRTTNRWLIYALIAVLLVVVLGVVGANAAGWISLPGGGENTHTPTTLASVPDGTPQAGVVEDPTVTATEIVVRTETLPSFTETPTATAIDTHVVLAETATPTPLPEIPTKTPAATGTSTPVSATMPTATPVPTEAATPIPTDTPTATRTPTATPTRFVTSTPILVTPTPTLTATATRRSTTPVPTSATAATPTPTTSRSPIDGGSVQLVSPPDNATSNGKVTFTWVSSYNLGANEGFELIFWESGQDPLTQGFGVASGPVRSTSVEVDIGANASIQQKAYLWGVRLVRISPYEKLRFLGGGRTFTKTGTSSAPPADTPVPPTPVPPTPVPPTPVPPTPVPPTPVPPTPVPTPDGG